MRNRPLFTQERISKYADVDGLKINALVLVPSCRISSVLGILINREVVKEVACGRSRARSRN